ncbi:hypothetical protein Y032_0123g1171 [Ancylostoma ceylanicum]|uniref:Uncharacterized protein n=1 Tax=Ancylostoma ceylanicum TaxID=53326 RepID=A0A016T8Q9_9BILA|nr:hypothetical protein Y032_0123g1171 [Ancylostoma ceylanicum]
MASKRPLTHSRQCAQLVEHACLSQIRAYSKYYTAEENSYRVGPGAQAVEHGSYLCKSACVPRDTPCQKRKVANVLKAVCHLVFVFELSADCESPRLAGSGDIHKMAQNGL